MGGANVKDIEAKSVCDFLDAIERQLETSVSASGGNSDLIPQVRWAQGTAWDSCGENRVVHQACPSILGPIFESHFKLPRMASHLGNLPSIADDSGRVWQVDVDGDGDEQCPVGWSFGANWVASSEGTFRPWHLSSSGSDPE